MTYEEYKKKREADPYYGMSNAARRYHIGVQNARLSELEQAVNDYRTDINALYKANNDRITTYEQKDGDSSLGSAFRDDHETYLGQVSDSKNKLTRRAADIRARVKQLGSALNEDYADYVDKLITDTDTKVTNIYKSASAEHEYYKNFADGAAYENALKAKQEHDKIMAYTPSWDDRVKYGVTQEQWNKNNRSTPLFQLEAANKAREEYLYKTYYQGIYKMKEDPDFEKYRAEGIKRSIGQTNVTNDGLTGDMMDYFNYIAGKEGVQAAKNFYDYAHRNGYTDAGLHQKGLTVAESIKDGLNQKSGRYYDIAENFNRGPFGTNRVTLDIGDKLNYVTEADRDKALIAIGKGDLATASAIFDDEKYQDERSDAYLEKYIKVNPGVSNMLAVGANVIAAPIEYVGDVLGYAFTGGKHSTDNASSRFASRVRAITSEDMSDTGKYIYNLAMSGVDSMSHGLINLAVPGLGYVTMFGSAAASATNDALDRGLDSNRALLNGLAAGAFEVVFEKLTPFDNIKTLREAATTGGKSMFKNALKSMVSNAGEEALTSAANILYDTAINGEYANYTWEELKEGQWVNALGEVGGEALAGAFMSVPFTAVGNITANFDAKAKYGDAQNELVAAGLSSSKDSQAYKLAQKNAARLAEGKDLSGKQLRYQAGALTNLDVNTIENAVKARLKTLGEGANVEKVASAIARSVSGADISAAEKLTIKNSKYGNRVLNELNTKNIESGQYSSQWTGDIGTKLINADAYGRNSVKSSAVNIPTVSDAATDNIPIVPGSKADVDPGRAAKDFSSYAQSVFDTVDTDIYEADIMNDAEVRAVLEEDEYMTKSALAPFKPSNGVVTARDPNADYHKTGRLVPLTAEQEWRRAEAAKAKTDTERSGILAGAKSEDIKTALMLSKAFGVDVIFDSSDMRLNGKFEGRTVTVNPDGGDVFNVVVMEELAHSAQGSKAYGKLIEQVRSYLGDEAYDAELDDIRVKYEQKYKSEGRTFTDADAEYEVTAKFLSSMFAGEYRLKDGTIVSGMSIEDFVRDNRSAAARMWYTLKKAVSRFKSNIAYGFQSVTVGSRDPDVAARRQAEMQLRALIDMRDRLGRALVEAKKARGTDGKASYSVNEDDNHFKVDKYFKSIMDRWEDLKHGAYVKVGTIDKKHPLALVGMPEGIIRYDVDKLKRNMSDHADYLTNQLLKTIPDIIADPVVISEYSEYGTVSVFGDLFIGKSPMMVGVTISKDRSGNNISKVRTFNTRRDVGKLITDEKVLYLDNNKKRTLDWFQACGIQVPLGGTKFGFIRSISHSDGSVKTSGESYDLTGDHIGTRAQTELEEKNRKIALDMYRRLSAGEDIGNGDLSARKYIFEKTGWAFDRNGKLIVDHEAPMYLADASESRKNARHAELVDAENAELKSENLGLREQLDEARTAVRDAEGKRSADYSSTVKVVRTVIGKVTDMLGGGYTKKQAAEYGKKILKIYDKRGDADAYGVRAVSDAEIAADVGALIAEMQDVRIEDAGRIETVKRLKAELKVPMFLSETARGDFAEGYGEVSKSYRGRVNFVSKGRGTPVDARYMELSDMFPEFFPKEIINEADQAQKILEVSYMIRDEEFVSDDRYDFSGGEQAREADAKEISKVIFDGFYEMDAAVKTEADRYARAAEKARRDAGAAIAKAREQIQAQADDRVDQIAHNYDVATEAMAADYRKATENLQEQAARSYQKERIKRTTNRMRRLYEHPSKERNIKEGERDLVGKLLDLTDGIFVEKHTAEDMANGDFSYATEREQENLDHLRELYAKRDELETKAQSEIEAGKKLADFVDAVNTMADVSNITSGYIKKGSTDQLLNMDPKGSPQPTPEASFDGNATSAYIISQELENVNAEIKKYESRLSGLFGRKRSELRNTAATSHLSALADAYLALKSSKDDYIRDAYNEDAYKLLLETLNDEELKGKTVRQLTSSDLNKIYQAIAVVVNAVYKSNNLFGDAKTMKIDESRSAVRTELSSVKGKSFDGKLPEAKRFYLFNNMRPDLFFKWIGSKTLEKLGITDIRKGEVTYGGDVGHANRFAQREKQKHHSKKWTDEAIEFHTQSGQAFSMELGERMTVYALLKRGKQARDHLVNGGIVLNDSDRAKLIKKVRKDASKGKVKDAEEVIERISGDATAYRLTDELIGQIIDTLTDDQKRFVDTMVEYLSEVMGAKGNEVFYELFGINRFTEDSYFPLESDKRYLNRLISAQIDPVSNISNAAFTKSTVDEASNPVIIRDFMDVWAGHVHDMAMYHAFAIPLANFNKVYGYARSGSAADGTDAISIRADIENVWGKAAVSYIDAFIKDVNGGVRGDPLGSWWAKGLSNWKKTKVAASSSVVIQQPTSIFRAMAYLNPARIIKRAVIRKPGQIRKQWAEIMEYAPVAVLKDMGGFDMNSSRSTTDYIKGDKTIMNRVDDVAMFGASVADKWAWCVMWNTCKDEVAAKHKGDRGFIKNSEAHLKEAAELFDKVISKTQVYDSVFGKSGFMRSKSELVKMSVSFFGEPTTSFNMILEGAYDFGHGNKNEGIRKIAASLSSIVFANAAKALIYAMRDDDEDEAFLEKYIEHFVSGIDDLNIVNYLPFFKDIYSIFKGYDAKRSDLAGYEALIDAFKGWTTDPDLNKTVDLVTAACELIGAPAGNVVREVKAFHNTFLTKRDFTTTKEGVAKAFGKAWDDAAPIFSWLGDKDSKTTELYKAYTGGSAAYIDRLRSGYKDEDAYEAALKTGLRENDERIIEAVNALIDGDPETANGIVEDIAGEGHFDAKLVSDAVYGEQSSVNDRIGTAASALDEGDLDTYKTVVNELAERGYDKAVIEELIEGKSDELANEAPEDEDEAHTFYKASQIDDCFKHGNYDTIYTIVDELIRVKIENDDGDADDKEKEKKAKSDVKRSVTSNLKPIYLEAYASGDTRTMSRIEEVLVGTGLYGTLSAVKNDTLADWRGGYDKEHSKKSETKTETKSKSSSSFGIEVPKVEIPSFEVDIPKFDLNF